LQKEKNLIDDFKGRRPSIHDTAYIAPSADVIGKVNIGKDCSIWHNAVLRGDVDEIIIKTGANIQDGCIVHCSENIKTIVGEGTTVGHNAVLHSCTIGENSLVGMGAVLLDNVSVGDNCLIAAGSLLTPGTVIPDGSMVMGSPGKVRRSLTENEIKGISHNSDEYMALKEIYRSKE
jgi:carbonic anhydrase/acetyltransferase-like protein (isoleucine patch superfamily)